MIQLPSQPRPTDDSGRTKWFNSRVTFHEGTLTDIREHIPEFEWRGFGLTQPGGEQVRLNEHLDTIVRLPFGEDKTFIPLGVVSKDYTLVQHTAVLDVASRALDAASIALADVHAEVKITEYGERMALSLFLPDKYRFDPGDGHPMALRLECVNSVDGSTRFRALMGWFRFVCGNGLIVGVTRSDIRRRHVGDLQLQDIGKVLSLGLKESIAEKKNFETWRTAPITQRRLEPWVDEVLRRDWGFKAATRVFNIARTGSDARIVGQYKGRRPTTIAVEQGTPVPGTPRESRNLYDVSQILAWLAKERRDVQEQIEWREQIPDLMAAWN